jgi:hypothetical protein
MKESLRLNLAQRMIWGFRFLVFPTARMSLHLPSEGVDLDKNWRQFSRSEHRGVREEIEDYLKDRFGGITFEIYEKRSEGEWQGKPEKNAVFYLDLDFSMRDIAWFFQMKDEWGARGRFNQELIYITLHPIWTMEKTEMEKLKTKRRAGSMDPAI